MASPVPFYVSWGGGDSLSWKCWKYCGEVDSWMWELRRFFQHMFGTKDVSRKLRDEQG